MQQLSGMDATFVYAEGSNSPQHVGSVAIYDPSTSLDGPIRFKDVLRFFESRLAAGRAFRQKLVRVPLDLDHPYWVEDDDFDLEYHVRHIALPAPGDRRQLSIQAARIHSRPLDMTKPLWEYWIVEGLDNIEGIPKGSWAIISKVHHAAIDGASGVELTAALHDLTPEWKSRRIDDDWKPEPTPNPVELLAKAQLNALTQPWRLGETILKTLPGVAELRRQVSAGQVSIDTAERPPKTRFNQPLSAHRVLDGIAITMDEIKEIRQAVPGATVNDVLLSVIGGGLRRYLQSKDELPEASMNAGCPISVRSETEKSSAGNQVSMMLVTLGTNISEPLERLQRILDDSKNSKAMVGALGAKTISQYSEHMPGALVGLASRLAGQTFVSGSLNPVANCVVTNVPGSTVPLYFCGAKMVSIYGMGPIVHGMGLINIIHSHCGEFTLSFTSDRAMIPDPAEYAAALRASFDQLLAAAREVNQTAAKPVQAKPRPQPRKVKKAVPPVAQKRQGKK